MNKFSSLPNDLYHILIDYLNNVDLLLFSHMNKKLRAISYKNRRGPIIDLGFMNNIIKYGYLDILIYFYSKGHKSSHYSLELAVSHNRLDILKYLHTDNKNNDDENFYQSIRNTNLCALAAQNGSLECLKFLHQNGYYWDEDTCYSAACRGQLSCLTYARENKCDFSVSCLNIAAERGYLDCVKYIFESLNNLPYVRIRPSKACTYAAQGGSLECLKYLHEKGCKWDSNTTGMALNGDYIECFKYAILNGCPWNRDDFLAFALINKKQKIAEWIQNLS